MTDSRTVTGSKDDLVVDASRCLRMRFSESSCRCCIDICPHGAVSLDSGLVIDPQQCRGCLLCTAVCPVGALEQSSDFDVCLTQLAKVSEPILGCIRTQENSNGTVACLGGLSGEHLLALYHSSPGRLILNLSSCGDCPNSPMIPELEQRLEAIAAAGLTCGICRINLAKSAEAINFRDEPVDRRSFFKSFGTALFRNAAVILTSANERAARKVEYAGKRVPLRRELLNKIKAKLSPALAVLTRKHFDSGISFDESCTSCLGCVAICPTGALQAELSDSPPTFEQQLCTGCGLCEEFCLESAVRITAGSNQE